jgi:hypothetical protein
VSSSLAGVGSKNLSEMIPLFAKERELIFFCGEKLAIEDLRSFCYIRNFAL